MLRWSEPAMALYLHLEYRLYAQTSTTQCFNFNPGVDLINQQSCTEREYCLTTGRVVTTLLCGVNGEGGPCRPRRMQVAGAVSGRSRMMSVIGASWWDETMDNFRSVTSLQLSIKERYRRRPMVELTSWSPLQTPTGSSNGSTLCDACVRGNVDAVSAFLQKFPSRVNDCDEYGRPALLYAAEGFHTDHLACLNVMLDVSGCDVNACDVDGDTALTVACRAGRAAAVRVLLNTGKVKVNMVNRQGQSALHVAANKGFIVICREVLESGIKVDFQDDLGGATSLHLAAGRRDTEVVILLLRHDANVNLQGHDGRTALHCACLARSLPVVRLLIDAGADLNLPDALGQLPVHHVVSDENLVRLLVSNGSEVNSICLSPLHFACQRVGAAPGVDLEYAKFLLASGANVDAEVDGQRPIDMAVAKSKVDVIFELLYWNCSVRRRGGDRRFPLFTASVNKSHPIVQMLYEAGANVSNVFRTRRDGITDASTGNPRTLQSICRISIRDAVGRNIQTKVKQLALPSRLKDYILLEDFRQLTTM